MYFEHLKENFENYQVQKTFPLLELLDNWNQSQTNTTQKDYSDKLYFHAYFKLKKFETISY